MFAILRPAMTLTVLFSILILANGIGRAENEQWVDNLVHAITVTKGEFLLGEPICIKLHLFNLANETISVLDREGRYFNFTATDDSGKPLKDALPTQLSAWSSPVQLSAGADFNDVVCLNRYLHFPGPGTFRVRYHGHLNVRPAGPSLRDPNDQLIGVSGELYVKLRRGSAEQLEAALREYLNQLKTGNRRLQRQAARALAISEPTVAVKLLKEALQAENGVYRYAFSATTALGRIGTDEAIQAITHAAMHHDNVVVRTYAIIQLGRRRFRQALPNLIDLLSDTNPRVRIAALRALGIIGDNSCVHQLEAILDDPDEDVRNTAREVYNLLTEAKPSKNPKPIE